MEPRKWKKAVQLEKHVGIIIKLWYSTNIVHKKRQGTKI